MNRRDFLEALAGIPLLGLLVKLLEKKDPYHEIDIFNGASHVVDLTWDNAERLAGLLVRVPEGASELKIAGYPDLVSYISDYSEWHTTSSNTTSGPTMTYWDGQRWIPMRVKSPWSWRTELA